MWQKFLISGTIYSHSHSHLILDTGSAYYGDAGGGLRPLERDRGMQIMDPGSGGCGCGRGLCLRLRTFVTKVFNQIQELLIFSKFGKKICRVRTFVFCEIVCYEMRPFKWWNGHPMDVRRIRCQASKTSVTSLHVAIVHARHISSPSKQAGV